MTTNPATILVVEDETSIATFVAAYLRNAGYGVKTAATAQAALIQLASDAPALVILDLNLPDGEAADESEDKVEAQGEGGQTDEPKEAQDAEYIEE